MPCDPVQAATLCRSAGGKSLETLEALTHDKATMEVQLSTQQKLLADMRHELALSKENQAMAESMAGSRSTQVLTYPHYHEQQIIKQHSATNNKATLWC